MNEFLNESFFDRIFSLSINSAIMLDLDQKRRFVETFFESNKSLFKTKRKFEKGQRQVGKTGDLSLCGPATPRT